MDKLFYPGSYTPHKEPTRGTIVQETADTYTLLVDGGTFMVSKNETRNPWEPQWWEFYKADDFYKSIWLHGGFIAWFFLFIY